MVSASSDFIVETDRLGLRRMVPADAAFISSMFDDPEARRFYPEMWRIEMGERWVQRNLERYDHDGLGLLIIVLRETGQPVGDCGLIWQTVEDVRELEVAYHVHTTFRRRGIAAEAAAACMAWGFDNTPAERIVSMVHPDNHASHGVAGRIHLMSRRFERMGDRYFLYYSDRTVAERRGRTTL